MRIRVPFLTLLAIVMWLLAVVAVSAYGSWPRKWWIIAGCLVLIVYAMWQQNRARE